MLPISSITSRRVAAKATGALRALVLAASVALLAVGCSDPAPAERAVAPNPTPEPSATREPRDTERGPGCRPDVAAPPETKPHYTMTMSIDPDARVVRGSSEVRFVAERPTARLVFRLWPNGPVLSAEGAELDVEKTRLSGGAATVTSPDPTTLVFELPERLAPGESATASMDWNLQMPGGLLDRISQNGNAVRLGSFFPILSWEGERGWATDPPTTTLAESSTSPTADFDVTIEVPDGLRVIATGREVEPGRWEARDVRDFAVAAAEFDVVERTVRAPRPVAVTVGVASGLDADADAFAAAISRALRDLSGRYGDYPWTTLSMAIMPDLGGSGIEYPTMIFQGDDSLRWATTHEVAHSWFYALVGNNQARDPWLDEGITSWAQARGDDMLGFFRDFDIGSARGELGQPMRYWDDHERDYYAGVYVQGVLALDALGAPKKVDCALRRYVAQNAYTVAEPRDVLDALEPSFPRAARVLRRFGVRP